MQNMSWLIIFLFFFLYFLFLVYVLVFNLRFSFSLSFHSYQPCQKDWSDKRRGREGHCVARVGAFVTVTTRARQIRPVNSVNGPPAIRYV
jgi:hypothetical protein